MYCCSFAPQIYRNKKNN
ncbi:hypothetical protein [Flavobacterium sp.]